MKLNKQIALGALAFALSSGSIYAASGATTNKSKWNPLNWFSKTEAPIAAPVHPAPCPTDHKDDPKNKSFIGEISKSEYPNAKAAACLAGATVFAGGVFFFANLASKPLNNLLTKYVYPRVKVTTEEGKELRKKTFEVGIPAAISLLLGTYIFNKVKNNTLPTTQK
jgi:hypothetical protein